jgi:hypothetical protein
MEGSNCKKTTPVPVKTIEGCTLTVNNENLDEKSDRNRIYSFYKGNNDYNSNNDKRQQLKVQISINKFWICTYFLGSKRPAR